jgi:ketosteroid isomerase-like protein
MRRRERSVWSIAFRRALVARSHRDPVMPSHLPGGQPGSVAKVRTTAKESEMTYDNEAIVRHAYHTAEGSVLDVAGFVAGFAEDGVINLGWSGQGKRPAGQEQVSYRGEHVGDLVLNIAELYPDVHRELHRVNVLGDMVAVEVSIQGTFLGPLETPVGLVQPTGVEVDVPTADFWYLRDGKIEMFDCYVMVSTMLDQIGVIPDFASAVAARRS